MSKLRELDVGGLSEPADLTRLPETLPTMEETSALAFCPLLVRHAGKGMCGNVDCRSCQLPYIEFEELEIGWFCSTCADGNIHVLPYYGDGKCTGCGRPSCILMLGEVLDP